MVPAAGGVVLLLSLVLLALLVTGPVGAATSGSASLPVAPADECAGSATIAEAARPADLARRYDLSAMHAAGDDGRGVTAAVLQFGMSVDESRFHTFQRCLGLAETPMTQSLWQSDGPVVVPWVDPKPPQLPDPGREAQSDVDVLTSTAIGLEHLYVLVSPTVGGGDAYYERLAAMIDALRTGAATGGRRPDVVSFSYGACEQQLASVSPAALDDLDRSMRELSEAGTWFFKGSGDAGSSDCSPFSGTDRCTGIVTPSAHFPATSPYVTAVGGLSIPSVDHRVIDGIARVWNTSADPTECSGGGGGISTRYARPAYQEKLPGTGPRSMRTIPDISALAGFPGFATYLPPETPGEPWTWVANGGDSLSGPMYAGAFASMLTALERLGIRPPASVNELLYEIASDPVAYAAVFRDVTEGDNATHAENRPPSAETVLYPAGVGYDLASGLGEVRMGALLAVLASPTVPTFTG